jgi:hypothetical protein
MSDLYLLMGCAVLAGVIVFLARFGARLVGARTEQHRQAFERDWRSHVSGHPSQCPQLPPRLPLARMKGSDGQVREMAELGNPALSAARRASRRSAARNYLSGVNSRGLQSELAPVVARRAYIQRCGLPMVARLREQFAALAARDLAAEQICYLFLEGWYPRVRIGGKRVRVPIPVTLGYAPTTALWCWICRPARKVNRLGVSCYSR